MRLKFSATTFCLVFVILFGMAFQCRNTNTSSDDKSVTGTGENEIGPPIGIYGCFASHYMTVSRLGKIEVLSSSRMKIYGETVSFSVGDGTLELQGGVFKGAFAEFWKDKAGIQRMLFRHEVNIKRDIEEMEPGGTTNTECVLDD